MKRKILPVLLLCTAILTPTLPAAALEEGAPIALAIRPVNGATVSEDGTIHITEEEAKEGKTIRLGVFIESESSGINRIGARIKSSDPAITFSEDSIYNPTEEINTTDITYVVGDVTFSTKFQPYCFGRLNPKGFYLPDCLSFDVNLISETDLYVYWMYGIGNSGDYLGGKSDALSFFEFDARIAPGTAPGTYSLEFLSDPNEQYPEYEHLTALKWDAGTAKKSDYRQVTPETKGVTITVEGTQTFQKGDVNHDGRINASDAGDVLLYAAKNGAGGADITEEERSRIEQLGDVNGDGSVNAKDANGILLYAAMTGTGTPVTWEEIFA